MIQNNNKNTPLIEEHIAAGAKITPFAGWNMPMMYAGIIKEYKSCRGRTAVFDTCHMGEFIYRGDLSHPSLQYAVTQDVSSMPVGSCKYGFILNEDGGIIDDQVILKLADDEAMFVVNAGTRLYDYEVLSERITSGELTDVSMNIAKIDIQGPMSRDVIKEALGIEHDPGFYRCWKQDLYGEGIIMSRTGYTGELGYEIYIDKSIASDTWRRLLADERVSPAGLGARDILRLEMGYSLYGSELDEETTPLQAGLEKFVAFNTDFAGKTALLKEKEEGLEKTKVVFRAESRRSPRHGYRIIQNEENIGYVTSGCFSPALSCGIGLGYLTSGEEPGGILQLISEDGTASMDARIAQLPFYRGGSLKD